MREHLFLNAGCLNNNKHKSKETKKALFDHSDIKNMNMETAINAPDPSGNRYDRAVFQLPPLSITIDDISDFILFSYDNPRFFL